MNWVKRIALVSTMAACLSGCNMYKLEELRHTIPSGTVFQSELSRLYMDYASVAENDYDWPNSWHFADKGLMLAYGKDAGPEDLNDWNISDSVRPDLEKARASLLSVLTPERMRESPSTTAEAQFYFDCWVKEQEQNWRESEIANCRDNLMKTLQDLNASGVRAAVVAHAEEVVVPQEIPQQKKPIKPAPVAAKIEKPKEEVKEPKAYFAESTSYAVFFEADKAEISEPGMNVITEVIKSLRNVDDCSVILHNSKDHLSKAAERIQVVRKILIAGGVKENAIRISSGKTEVESTKAPAHRVEIFLNE